MSHAAFESSEAATGTNCREACVPFFGQYEVLFWRAHPVHGKRLRVIQLGSSRGAMTVT